MDESKQNISIIALRFVDKLRQSRNFQKYWLGLVVCTLVGMSFSPVYAGMGIAPGGTLPEFEIAMPNVPGMRVYLGFEDEGSFSLSQIPARLIVVEFFDIYCHTCYQNAPIANQLYKSIEEDENLNKSIKMIGIGLASKSDEIAEYRQKFDIEFPVFADPQKTVRMKSKVKHVPLTIVIDKSGKVLMSHLGVIRNVDAFFAKIKKCHKAL